MRGIVRVSQRACKIAMLRPDGDVLLRSTSYIPSDCQCRLFFGTVFSQRRAVVSSTAWRYGSGRAHHGHAIAQLFHPFSRSAFIARCSRILLNDNNSHSTRFRLLRILRLDLYFFYFSSYALKGRLQQWTYLKAAPVDMTTYRSIFILALGMSQQ